jgi:hypothetical protein
MTSPHAQASSIAILALLALLAATAGAMAAEPFAADEPAAAPERVLTNQDLPTLQRMDASEAELPEPTPVGSGGPRPIRLAGATAEAAGEAEPGGDEPTVPELLDELARLRKQEMRLLVPFFSRRYVSLRPDETGVEEQPGRIVRYAGVQKRLAEVHAQLRQAGAFPPAREFGQPPDLFETDITESPPIITDISAGPGYPTERISETDDVEDGAPRVFYSLEELAAPVTTETFGDGRPEPLFTGEFDEVPVVMPR